MNFPNMKALAAVGAICASGNASCFDSCPAETGGWDGDFDKIDDFCSCNFGGDCPFICGGGGDGNDGGFCSQNPCATGQYSFDGNGWDISVSQSQAKGKSPYRAFAYLPFWGKVSQMNDFTFSVSLKATDVCKIGAHVNVLFWTDGGPIFSILAPGAPGDRTGSCRLLAFADTYPNNWLGEMEFADETWYDVKISVSDGAVTVSVNGNSWTNTAFAGDLSSGNGPQLGVYSFDFGGTWTTDSFHLTIGSVSGPGGSQERHDCEFQCLQDGGQPLLATLV